jgi:hypothetical protein
MDHMVTAMLKKTTMLEDWNCLVFIVMPKISCKVAKKLMNISSFEELQKLWT